MEIKQAKPERIMNADSKEWIRFRQEYSAKNSEYELVLRELGLGPNLQGKFAGTSWMGCFAGAN
jgi:hypothetical protein